LNISIEEGNEGKFVKHLTTVYNKFDNEMKLALNKKKYRLNGDSKHSIADSESYQSSRYNNRSIEPKYQELPRMEDGIIGLHNNTFYCYMNACL